MLIQRLHRVRGHSSGTFREFFRDFRVLRGWLFGVFLRPLLVRAQNAIAPGVRRASRSLLTALLAICIAAIASSCASLRGSPAPQDDTDAVTLNIVNHHQLNVVVYNVAQGHRD